MTIQQTASAESPSQCGSAEIQQKHVHVSKKEKEKKNSFSKALSKVNKEKVKWIACKTSSPTAGGKAKEVRTRRCSVWTAGGEKRAAVTF